MQVRQAEALGHAGQRRVPDHRHGHGFVGPEQRLAHRLLAGGHFLEQLLVPVRRFEIRTRHHPARRALEHFQLAHGFYQLRNNLNAAGAGADHRHALSGEVVVVVPARAVNLLALELLQAFDVREAGVGQRPLGHHRGAAAHHLAFFQRGFPQAGFLLERQIGDVAVEANVFFQIEFVHQIVDVIENLVAAGKAARPLRVGRERIGVQIGGDVAGGARVGVVPPGAADAVAPFQNHEIIDPRLLQPDRHAQPGKAGAHDQRRSRLRLALGGGFLGCRFFRGCSLSSRLRARLFGGGFSGGGLFGCRLFSCRFLGDGLLRRRFLARRFSGLLRGAAVNSGLVRLHCRLVRDAAFVAVGGVVIHRNSLAERSD